MPQRLRLSHRQKFPMPKSMRYAIRCLCAIALDRHLQPMSVIDCRLCHDVLLMGDLNNPTLQRYGPQYQQLVECQDYQGNIHAALESLRNSGVFKPSSRVVELGAGGGRLAKVIAPWVESYTALDKSEHMVEIARDNLQGCPNVTVAVAGVEGRESSW